MEPAARAALDAVCTRHPDFPKPGINFINVLPIFHSPELTRSLVASLAAAARALPVAPTVVTGVEARGFIFAPLLALELGLPFVPIRKAGKLPGAVETHSYDLEYGSASIQVMRAAFEGGGVGSVALVCDDLKATGGTAAAAVAVLQAVGVQTAAVLVIVEIAALGGAARLPEGVPTLTAMTV